MKNYLIPAVVAAFTFASTFASAQLRPPIIYPSDQENRKRDKDDRRRENDDRIIRDREGRVINRDGKVYRNDDNLPPGQAKKKYGGKSAKVYAPGQRKKSGNGSYSNLPQRRISIDDNLARRASNGQLYYTDANGYTYWKANDGYYYLDSKYSARERSNDGERYKNRDRDDDRDDDDDDDDDRKEKKQKKYKKGKK